MASTLSPVHLAIVLATALAACGHDPSAASALPSYGDPQCDRFGQIQLSERYMLQNNIFNDAAAGQSQCVSALWDGAGPRAGFVVSPIAIDVDGDQSATYPSLVLGWQWGTFYGAYSSARTVDSLTSVRSTWSFTAPADGRYNVQYDLWLHADANPPDPTDGLELMLWIATRDASPVGSMVAVVTLEGAQWEVWAGPHSGWTAVTYRRVSNATSADLDILPFIDDATARGYGQRDWHMLSVEAGFEIWQASQTFETHSYWAEIR
jgi:hypothetical protein